MAAGTLVRTALLKITADDGDTETKLTRISDRAKQLAAQHPELAVKVNTAAASAKLAVLRQELKDTGKQSDDTGSTWQNLQSRAGGLAQAVNSLTLGLSGGVGEMSMFQKMMWLANIATGVGEPLVAGLTVGIGGLAAGLVAGGGALGVFGLTAKAVYGQVSTAMQAYSAAQAQFDKATTKAGRLAALKAEQQATAGLTSSQKSLMTSLQGVQGAWQGFVNKASPGVIGVMTQGLGMVPQVLKLIAPLLVPAESALSQILSKLQGALWTDGPQKFIALLARNAEPAILGVATAVGNVVRGIGGILRAFMPASGQMLGGLDKITAKFAAWSSDLSSHSGFQSLTQMAKTDVPLLESALTRLGGIAKIVGSQMSSMSTFGNSRQFLQTANDVLKFADSLLKAHPGLVNLILYGKMGTDALGRMKTAFAGISGAAGNVKSGVDAVSNLRKGLKSAEDAADDATGAWGTFGGKLGSIGGKVKGAMSASKQAFSDFQSGLSDASAAESAFSGKWGTLGGKVASAASGIGSSMASLGSSAVAAFGGMKTAVTGAVTSIAEFGIGEKLAAGATKVWTGVQAAFDVVMDANPISLIIIAIAALVAGIVLLVVKCKPFRDFWISMWKDVQRIVGDAVSWIKGHWGILLSVIIGPMGMVVQYVVDHWKSISRGAQDMWHDVTGFFERLPGDIGHAIASLPGMLWNAGKHMIEMLAHGIESAVGDVTGAIGHIAGEITSHLPFSPAKKGPLSGAGSPDRAGARIARMLAQGMTSDLGTVQGAAARMAGATAVGAGGGGRAGGLVIEFHVPSSGSAMLPPSFWTAFVEGIRVRGGSEQIVTRKVVLA